MSGNGQRWDHATDCVTRVITACMQQLPVTRQCAPAHAERCRKEERGLDSLLGARAAVAYTSSEQFDKAASSTGSLELARAAANCKAIAIAANHMMM